MEMRFHKINFLNIKYIIAISFILFLNLVLFSKLNEVPLIAVICFSVIDLVFIGFIIWGVTAIIGITDQGILYKTLFRQTHIDWENVKSFGVYVVGKYYREVLKQEDYDKTRFDLKKYIYISTEIDFYPKSFKSNENSGSFFFDYRKNIIELIEDKIKIKKANA